MKEHLDWLKELLTDAEAENELEEQALKELQESEREEVMALIQAQLKKAKEDCGK